MKFTKKIRALLTDPLRSQNERSFIVLIVLAMTIILIALIGDIIYSENIIEMVGLAFSLIIVPILTVLGIRKGMLAATSKIISIIITFLVIPVSFTFGGGIEGGTVPWMVFAYLYMGLALTGWWKTIMLIVHTIMILGLYYAGFVFPSIIRERERSVLFLDSALAVVEVGIICFVMIRFQIWLFNEENKRAKEETMKVEELNSSQNRFFSSMSHEIRTPINSILGLNEIIMRQEDASEEIKKDAAGIQGAGRMLLAIINDILDFSKIEAGKMDIVPVNYNLGSLISEIVNMVWLKAQQKGLELKVEIDPSVPAELYGDEVRIKQILINILNNAVKYTREGTVTLRVEKEETKEDQVALTFTVADTGMGIKQDALPYLFDAFRRVDEERNTNIEGTGLGLSIVKQLVELMGGRITVNSVYTQGATFIVTLWQTVTRFDAIGEIDITNYTKTSGKNAYSAGFTAPDVRILIVDDNEMNLEVEKKLLIGTEITVDTAMSGREALTMTGINRYDIIFMDHLMPEMDGIECMHKIRNQNAGLNNKAPIIVLTANAGGENKELYARSGFEDYLVKPVSGRMLEDMIISHVPESKIIISDQEGLERMSLNATKGYKRKLPVIVATSSVVDIPKQVVKNYQLDIIPYSVRCGERQYFDGVEANTDELLKYVKHGQEFETVVPTIEQFEAFFANELKKAINVIFIASASNLSKEYENSCEAAKEYGNVQIFDSGSGSAAAGFLVLIAHRMAISGETPDRIIEELKRAKSIVRCSFVTDGSFYMRQKDSYSRKIADVMKTFSIRPILECHESVMRIERIGFGGFDSIYRKYIDHVLENTRPDTEVIFVIYGSLDNRQKELIRERINKHYEFEKIIFIKTSSVLALNVGEGGFGLAFFVNSGLSYSISSMLITDEADEEAGYNLTDENLDEVEKIPNTNKDVSNFWAEYREDYKDRSIDFTVPSPSKPLPEPMIIADSVQVSGIAAEPMVESGPILEPEHKWYDDIPGINVEMALENSGSEETFKSVIQIFYNSLDEKIAEIEKFYGDDDIRNYTIKVHAMKSSAKIIGAMDISTLSESLEFAGKEDNLEYIKAHHGELIEKLAAFKEILAQVLSEDVDEYTKIMIQSIYDALERNAKDKNKEMIAKTIKEAIDYSLPKTVMKKLDMVNELNEQENFEGIISALKG